MSFPRVCRLWLPVLLTGLILMFVAGCAQNTSDSSSRPDPKPAVEQVDDAESQPDSDAEEAVDADVEEAGDADVEETVADNEDDGSGAEVAIVGFAFQPATLTVKAGTTVVWTNEDAANHQVHADDDAYQLDSIGKDGQSEVTYDAPGTFTYHCHVHPNMQGTIIVE